jgi:extracellular factor (EF) 3-hydroxypalmitic acid methyl ester biosynthesis protein
MPEHPAPIDSHKPRPEQIDRLAAELERELATAERLLEGGTDPDHVLAVITSSLDRCLRQLAGTGCWGPANAVPSSRLWHRTCRWLQRSELIQRARGKPRGYAGDFELLDKIAGHWCGGEHPLGAVLDRYFQRQAAPQAVRQRFQHLAEAIGDCSRVRPAGARFACVGSGPAVEIQRAWPDIPARARARIRWTLFDIDPAALESAAGRYGAWLGDRLVCLRANPARLPTDRRWSHVRGQFDLVYCPGLFDYLEDEQAVRMLRLLQAWLAPGGRLLVYNFSPANPTRALMEWIGNWYLIHRDRHAVQRLLARAGLDDACARVYTLADDVLVVGEVASPAAKPTVPRSCPDPQAGR